MSKTKKWPIIKKNSDDFGSRSPVITRHFRQKNVCLYCGTREHLSCALSFILHAILLPSRGRVETLLTLCSAISIEERVVVIIRALHVSQYNNFTEGSLCVVDLVCSANC